jgi:formylglycine-generating enzyme required for sulfatase activity
VVRGGSWGYDAVYLRSSYRNGFSPGFAYFGNGFRVARAP